MKKSKLDIELEELYSKAKPIVDDSDNYDIAEQRLVNELDVSVHYARNIIDNLHTLRENKINFKRSILLGFTAIVVAIGITLVSYFQSIDEGGFVYYTYGILGYGIIMILKGFILYK